MHFDWTSAGPDSHARALAVAAMIVGVALPMACAQGGSGSGCVAHASGTAFDFDDSITLGFDDTSSFVAMMGVAIDDNGVMGAPDSALVIALQFPNSVAPLSMNFSPTCDTAIAIDSYMYAQTDSTTSAAAVATATAFIAPILTDTAGIEGMDHSMNALLVIDDDPDRYFLAVSGSITVTRDDPASPTLGTVTGDLTFVELDGASTTAGVLSGGEIPRIDDIDFVWDTFDQP
jgi:hypothetical protein